jgi:hypothetical protein
LERDVRLTRESPALSASDAVSLYESPETGRKGHPGLGKKCVFEGREGSARAIGKCPQMHALLDGRAYRGPIVDESRASKRAVQACVDAELPFRRFPLFPLFAHPLLGEASIFGGGRVELGRHGRLTRKRLVLPASEAVSLYETHEMGRDGGSRDGEGWGATPTFSKGRGSLRSRGNALKCTSGCTGGLQTALESTRV